jgi:hypothetical protein
MKYAREGDEVTLEMTVDSYLFLLMLLGISAGHLYESDRPMFWRAIRFVNELNADNPAYKPYELPPDPEGEQ